MYVEMSPPNSRHSEPRNTHIPSFSLLIPVWVQPCSPGAGVCGLSFVATAVVASANGGLLGLGGHRGLVGDLGDCRRVVVRGSVVVAVAVIVASWLVARLESPAVHGDDHDHATEGS